MTHFTDVKLHAVCEVESFPCTMCIAGHRVTEKDLCDFIGFGNLSNSKSEIQHSKDRNRL